MSNLIMAIVGSVEADGIHLLIAGSTAPTAKGYRSLAAASVEAGDAVLVAELSGTRVVLDKIV